MTPTIRRRGVRSAARQLKSCRSRSRTDGQKPRICDDPRVHQQVLRGTPSRCAPESARQHLTSSPRPRSLPPPSVAGVCHVLGPNVAVVCSDLSPSCSQIRCQHSNRQSDSNRRWRNVRSFLAACGITLSEGDPDDGPSAETAHGLGNRKNELFQRTIQRRADPAWA